MMLDKQNPISSRLTNNQIISKQFPLNLNEAANAYHFYCIPGNIRNESLFISDKVQLRKIFDCSYLDTKQVEQKITIPLAIDYYENQQIVTQLFVGSVGNGVFNKRLDDTLIDAIINNKFPEIESHNYQAHMLIGDTTSLDDSNNLAIFTREILGNQYSEEKILDFAHSGNNNKISFKVSNTLSLIMPININFELLAN